MTLVQIQDEPVWEILFNLIMREPVRCYKFKGESRADTYRQSGMLKWCKFKDNERCTLLSEQMRRSRQGHYTTPSNLLKGLVFLGWGGGSLFKVVQFFLTRFGISTLTRALPKASFCGHLPDLCAKIPIQICKELSIILAEFVGTLNTLQSHLLFKKAGKNATPWILYIFC